MSASRAALPPPPLRISAIPQLSDNYGWLVEDTLSHECVLVDAAEAAPCIARIPPSARLVALLTTHKHRDHSGGNAAFPPLYPGLRIYGGAADAADIPALTAALSDGSRVAAGARLDFLALHTPCHTRGHTCFYLESARAVFTGDTLFCGGIGRFFEGTAVDMQASLARLASLPGDTRVLCGHEYTADNLAFGAAIEPSNAALKARIAAVQRLRAQGLPSVGESTIADELATNVFLRTHVAEVLAAVGLPEGSCPVDCLARLRERKNAWKP